MGGATCCTRTWARASRCTQPVGRALARRAARIGGPRARVAARSPFSSACRSASCRPCDAGVRSIECSPCSRRSCTRRRAFGSRSRSWRCSPTARRRGGCRRGCGCPRSVCGRRRSRLAAGPRCSTSRDTPILPVSILAAIGAAGIARYARIERGRRASRRLRAHRAREGRARRRRVYFRHVVADVLACADRARSRCRCRASSPDRSSWRRCSRGRGWGASW